MTEFELSLPKNTNMRILIELLDQSLAAHNNLRIAMRDTLKKYPGSTHWHVKQGKQRGVLEITVWPQGNRAWFSIHRNRTAPWIEPAIAQLSALVEAKLAG